MSKMLFSTLIRYEGISNKIVSNIPVKINGIDDNLRALWDTGATITSLSKEKVYHFGLKSVGTEKINSFSGTESQDYFTADITLIDATLNDIQIIEAKLLPPNIDIIIGMNIISHGDFAISNFNGETQFSFRIPSLEHLNLTTFDDTNL